MKFPWSKKKPLVTQGYRLQLDSIVQGLRMAVGDVPEDSPRAQLIAELDHLETQYRMELRALRQLEE